MIKSPFLGSNGTVGGDRLYSALQYQSGKETADRVYATYPVLRRRTVSTEMFKIPRMTKIVREIEALHARDSAEYSGGYQSYKRVL